MALPGGRAARSLQLQPRADETPRHRIGHHQPEDPSLPHSTYEAVTTRPEWRSPPRVPRCARVPSPAPPVIRVDEHHGGINPGAHGATLRAPKCATTCPPSTRSGRPQFHRASRPHLDVDALPLKGSAKYRRRHSRFPDAPPATGGIEEAVHVNRNLAAVVRPHEVVPVAVADIRFAAPAPTWL